MAQQATKMTLSGLATFTASYVAAAKQGASWSATTEQFSGMLDKIGKQVTIDGLFYDQLPELNGDSLPLGKTIEEYFIDLSLPAVFSMTGTAYNYDTEGAKDLTPAVPVFESTVYNYTLGRAKVKTTVPYDQFEKAMNSATDLGNLTAKIIERLQNSVDITRYAEKKQLLGNAIDKACSGVSGTHYVVIAAPVDTSTGEAFITQVKKDVETASFANEQGLATTALNSVVIGAAPENALTLFIKKGYMPSLEVDTYAGAFNPEKLGLNCRVKVVDDFGTITNTTAYALLVDSRGIKLHNSYNATRATNNADGDFVNTVRHWEDTGYISKYCFIKAYKAS